MPTCRSFFRLRLLGLTGTTRTNPSLGDRSTLRLASSSPGIVLYNKNNYLLGRYSRARLPYTPIQPFYYLIKQTTPTLTVASSWVVSLPAYLPTCLPVCHDQFFTQEKRDHLPLPLPSLLSSFPSFPPFPPKTAPLSAHTCLQAATLERQTSTRSYSIDAK